MEYVAALVSVIQTLRESLNLFRELKGASVDALQQKLDDAERQLKMAEVAAARGLGYQICKRHWPPGIMVDESYRADNGPLIVKRRCPDCGFVEEPPPPRTHW